MALLKIDWNPGDRKVRQFGLLLAGLSLPLAAFWAWRGHDGAGKVLGVAGPALGLLSAALPGSAGLAIWKAWMGVSYAIGLVVGPALLGLVYFGVVTPIAFALRLAGRDALRLKRPAADSYWVKLEIPKEKSYFERLF